MSTPHIVVSKYLADVGAVAKVTPQSLKPWIDSGEISIGVDGDDDKFVVSWGGPSKSMAAGGSGVVFETGFFWDGAHVDYCGLYQNCTLGAPSARRIIGNFKAPAHAADIVLGGPTPPSKYRQTGDEEVFWDGVVLAAQNPTDRSIRVGGSTEGYWEFFEGACKKYGPHLFVKKHPWNSGDVEKRMDEIAAEYKCRCEKTNHSVIKNCKFVLVYNSTFAVDCFIRLIPVAQYAPGYFSSTPAVTYTDRELPDSVKDTVDAGMKLADFLIWRYCINMNMPIEKWVRLFKHLATTPTLFPIDGEFSYAANL